MAGSFRALLTSIGSLMLTPCSWKYSDTPEDNSEAKLELPIANAPTVGLRVTAPRIRAGTIVGMLCRETLDITPNGSAWKAWNDSLAVSTLDKAATAGLVLYLPASAWAAITFACACFCCSCSILIAFSCSSGWNGNRSPVAGSYVPRLPSRMAFISF